jgi:hypothetical protein
VSQEEIEQALALIARMTRDDLEGPEFTDTYSDTRAKIMPKDTIASAKKMAATKSTKKTPTHERAEVAVPRRRSLCSDGSWDSPHPAR